MYGYTISGTSEDSLILIPEYNSKNNLLVISLTHLSSNHFHSGLLWDSSHAPHGSGNGLPYVFPLHCLLTMNSSSESRATPTLDRIWKCSASGFTHWHTVLFFLTGPQKCQPGKGTYLVVWSFNDPMILFFEKHT